MPELPPVGALQIELEWLLSVLRVVVVFGLIIFVHEFGHFIFAKLTGVRVDKFSLGFGKKLFGFKWGETEYVVSLLPLGGYVKMAGEMPGEESSEPEREFTSKKVWERALIIGAGPVTNFLFAFPMAMLSLLIGVNVATSHIGQPLPSKPAFKAGLRSGDRIVRIDDGEPIEQYKELQYQLNFEGDNSKPRKFVVEREIDGETVRVEKRIKPVYSEESQLHIIGVPPLPGRTISHVSEYGTRAGLRDGDQVVAVDGRPVNDFHEIVDAIAAEDGEPVELVIRRGDPPTEYKTTYTPPTKDLELIGVVTDRKPKVRYVQGDSPASEAGLKSGDRIKTVAGEPTITWQGMVDVFERHAGGTVELLVNRDGKDINVTLEVPEDSAWRSTVGLAPAKSVVVASFSKDSKASQAGLKVGDEIVMANQEEITTVSDLHRALESSPGEAELKVKRGENKTAEVTVPLTSTTVVDRGNLGFAGTPHYVREQYALGAAVVEGGKQVLDYTGKTISSLMKMFSGRISSAHVAGPVGIFQMAYMQSREGLGQLLNLFVLISVGLALLNLMPVPVLDGGHLLFLLIELARGKRMSDRVLEISQYVGLALLLGLMVFATKNDVFRLFQ